MPSKYVEGVYPKYIDRGDGAYIYAGERGYIDYPLGLGAVLLGHNIKEVNMAVLGQLTRGNIFPLPHPLETVLAEKIRDLIPCAEKVRFLRTGSEACSASVRIARAYTKRQKVICCGYHGWHDWYNQTTTKALGTPKDGLVTQLKYNDYEAFAKHFADNKNEIACIIMEPYVYDAPKDEFLKRVAKLCRINETLLIFDEVVTGFRTKGYSAQKMFGIKPDLSCFGKAMANGLPISCVCGSAKVMDVLEGDCFVSSTFGGELTAISAALATIKFMEENGVLHHIWSMGDILKNQFNVMAKQYGMHGCECIGYPCRTFFKFPSAQMKSLFWQECLRRGVFFGYAQFVSFSHQRDEIDKTIAAMREAFKIVRKYKDNPSDALDGKSAEETLRLVEEKKDA
jgi:glutamate-1-semialdehyde aminotransferase